jgi:hypothetical protein
MTHNVRLWGGRKMDARWTLYSHKAAMERIGGGMVYACMLILDFALLWIDKAYLYNRIYFCFFTQVTAQMWITKEEKSGKS